MFWVGGTNNWSNAGSWSATSGGAGGVGPPTSSDDAIFDANSNTTNAGYTVTINVLTRVCKDLIFSAKPGDGLGGTITWAGIQGITISGSLTCLAGMTRTYTGTLTFDAGSAGKTLTLNGVVLNSSMFFNNAAGGWTLQDNLTTATLVLTAGALDSGGHNITVTSGGVSSTGSASRSLTLGASSVIISSTITQPWNVTSSLALSAGTSTIKLTGVNTPKTFIGGDLSYNNVELTGSTNPIFTTTFAGSNTFNDIKYMSPGTTHSINFTAGTTTTVNTFTVSGTSGHLVTLGSTTTAAFNLVKSGGGTISCDFLNITHSAASPALTWFAGSNSTNVGTATANSGWIFDIIHAITPANGSLSIGGLSPVFTQNYSLVPDAGSLALGFQSPILRSDYYVIPGAGQLALSPGAPLVRSAYYIGPGAGQLTLTPEAPIVVMPIWIFPQCGELSFTGHAPPLPSEYVFRRGVKNVWHAKKKWRLIA